MNIENNSFGDKLKVGQIVHEETGPTGWHDGTNVKVVELFEDGGFSTVWDDGKYLTKWDKFGRHKNKNHGSYIVRPR